MNRPQDATTTRSVLGACMCAPEAKKAACGRPLSDTLAVVTIDNRFNFAQRASICMQSA
jgi:hypothetical protein